MWYAVPMLHHRWDITPKQAIALQRELAGRIRQDPMDRPVRLIAGTDCAFLDGGRTILAVAVLCQAPRPLRPARLHSRGPWALRVRLYHTPDATSASWPELPSARPLEVLHWSHCAMPCTFPYVPGLLSFREAPAVIAAIEQLPLRPDLLMCDGQGLAHPRGLGLACHVGLWLDVPVIGVAKSRLCGEFRPPGRRRGCHTRLLLEGRAVGSVVRTADGVRPLFVSVGHRIDLAGAIRWTLRCARGYRLPEPTRQAHIRVSFLTRNPGHSALRGQ